MLTASPLSPMFVCLYLLLFFFIQNFHIPYSYLSISLFLPLLSFSYPFFNSYFLSSIFSLLSFPFSPISHPLPFVYLSQFPILRFSSSYLFIGWSVSPIPVTQISFWFLFIIFRATLQSFTLLPLIKVDHPTSYVSF